jgi:predicted amidohydrolase
MKISLIQMNSQPDRQYNLAQAALLMREAIERDAPDLIVLPEHFDWSGGTAEQKYQAADLIPDGRAYSVLQEFAAAHKIWLHAGTVLERIAGSNRIYNTTVIFSPDGEEVGRYRKIHLFDIVAPDGKAYRESDKVEAGRELLVYEANGYRIGCAICYDLRFSRLFDQLSGAGAEIVILPAAFTLQTGKDHWEVLCRARAIEFQTYFVACGQWGAYPVANGEERRTYGNSLVCDPWGHVIARASDKVGFITAHIDKERIETVRQLIPMASHRVDPADLRLHLGASFATGCQGQACGQCATCRRKD